MFIWGASFGFMIKMCTSRAAGMAFTSSNYKYNRTMVISKIYAFLWDYVFILGMNFKKGLEQKNLS